jgi:hypothetical protein
VGVACLVAAGKVFRLAEATNLADIASMLQGFRTEEEQAEGDHKFTLVNEVMNLTLSANTVTGAYSHDYVLHIFHRGKVVPLPRTVEAMFSFAQQGKRLFLTVVEKKRLANFIANKLNGIIFEKVRGVVEARIAPETLRGFHSKNPEDTKITFFDNVDIPNVDKLSLYGPDLVGTTLFDEYSKHGDLWYIVTKAREYGYVVGITRDASVVVFNLTDKNKFLEYVAKEIYPLIAS